MQLRLSTQLDGKSQDLIELRPLPPRTNSHLLWQAISATRAPLLPDGGFPGIKCDELGALHFYNQRNTAAAIKLRPHSKLDQRLTAFL